MSIIDIHTHAFPDSLAGRAIASLEEGCRWKAVADGTIGGLLAGMDSAGVQSAAICTIATKADQADGILSWCEQIRSDRIIPFPSVHPDTPHAGQAIERIAKRGFTGIKLHPMYQNFSADEARLDEIYAAAADNGLLVTLHSGRDIAFPDDDRAMPEKIVKVIQKHPKLRLLCTHLGGWQAWDEVEQVLIGQPIYLETSFSLQFLPPQRAADMIRRHGTDRVCFGTDWPWQGHIKQLELVDGLGLSDSEKHALLGGNAAALLGLEN